MHIFGQAFVAPKAGASDAEFEDAVWPDRVCERNGLRRFRCAVADGATETSFSRSWAHLLVGAFANDRLLGPEQLKSLRLRWRRGVERRLRTPHPWYVDQKAESGAFAALVTLDLIEDAPDRGNWTSYALGDSCLVQIRGDELLAAFPLSASLAFNTRPRLVGSTLADPVEANDFCCMQGEWFPDDTFYLMSDAIACWFLKQVEADKQPWELLRNLGSEEMPPFPEWLATLRRERAIKNDDVTVLRIDVFPDVQG
jgi:hypothetical protein